MGQFLQDYGLGRQRPRLLAKKSYMLRQRPSPIRGGVRPYFLTGLALLILKLSTILSAMIYSWSCYEEVAFRL